MTDIMGLFDKLSLNDDTDDIINEFSTLSLKCMADEKEINNIINSFDNLTINKQQQCINVIHKNIDKNPNIKIFLEKIGMIMILRYNKKCYIEKMPTNNYSINC